VTDPRVRRPPPPLVPGRVAGHRLLTPRLLRLTVEGLAGIRVDEPAASVRLLLPEPVGLTIPTWNGNEFLLPDGSRPGLRTLTPVAADADAGTLDLDIILHGAGRLTDWARAARPGDPVAVSGPGRGHRFDPEATAHLILGDETAIPAVRQLLAVAPPALAEAVIEVAHRDAIDASLVPDAALVTWIVGDDLPGDALLAALVEHPMATGTHVWAAGEAAAMQRIRRHLFETRGLLRAAATVRGYWKHGRSGT
jgi:NADPH-dependent ferric siderophore reductase